ncbi:MAG: YggS family pyridoxal phosphate-dependent enzyme [Candidatus Omnitrophica bacterium]|nr:YggS family pyridoxal phosphate-dependent enzyme [Candidatus Omnitrophota bacterium]
MIKENVRGLLQELPAHVELVAAAKARTAEEILEAIEAGVKIIGENYVQEAQRAFEVIGSRAKWHFIGHLQKNKVKKAVKLFDMIETVDSKALAVEIDKICAQENKVMQVLVEINSGREKQKFGVMPEEAEGLIKELSRLRNISIMGLMAMGPYAGDPELTRPYFRETKRIFDNTGALGLAGVQMKYLSMGMTNSYRIAIEEGANVVRIGSKIFGEREEK